MAQNEPTYGGVAMAPQAPFFTAKRIAALWVAYALVAVTVFGLLQVARGVIIGEMGRRTVHIAELTANFLNPADLAAVRGPGDTGKPEFQQLRDRLAESCRLYPDIAALYALRKSEDGSFRVIVDSRYNETSMMSGHDPGDAFSAVPSSQLSQFLEESGTADRRPRRASDARLSAFAPLMDRDTGKAVALIGVDVSRAVVDARSRPLNLASVGALVVLVGLVTLAFRAVFARARALEAIKALEVQVKRRNDELREANNRLNDSICTLRDREKLIQQDINLAREVQQRLLPETFPFQGRLDFAAFYEPCATVGGDLYDAFPAGERLVGFYVADASGHGVSAALSTATLKATAENSRRLITEDAYSEVSRSRFGVMSTMEERIANYMAELNRGVTASCRTGSFVTFLVGVLNIDTGELHIGNAGHNPPIVCNKEGSRELEVPSNIAFGLLEDFKFEIVVMRLEECSRIILYTDGVTERRNRQGDELGIPRLVEMVHEFCGKPAWGLVSALRERLEGFAQGEAAHDDQALLVVEYRAAEAGQTKS